MPFTFERHWSDRVLQITTVPPTDRKGSEAVAQMGYARGRIAEQGGVGTKPEPDIHGQRRRVGVVNSMGVLAIAALLTASATAAFVSAAQRFVPGVRWRSSSVVSADFTCQGHEEVALLGTTTDEIVVAVFLNGPSNEPKVLRYSAKARNAATVELSVEPPGRDPDAPFLSGKCQGLRLEDNEIDATHIYWNPDAREFADWVR